MNEKIAVEIEVVLEVHQARWASVWSKSRVEVLAVVSILLGAIAQLMLKCALLLWSGRRADARFDEGIVAPLAGMLFGLAVYAIGTLFWLKAVARASISYLYPLSAGSYALVALGGHFLFGESIQVGRWTGIGVITLGVSLLAFSNLRGGE